jgi:hypothetical protein
MWRKKKVPVAVPFSPIKFDRFGKVCRFVNQKGSVLPTETEMFSCEIVRDLPDYVYDFVKQIGFDSVISVPISNHNGLTGSGKKGECHRNSQMLSLSIGGHRICGLVISIYKHKKELCFMHGHSVWNTPEGKTRCVTNYQMREGFRDKLLTKLVMGETLLFVPVGMNDVDNDNNFCLDNFIIYEGDDSFCLQYNRGTPKEILENQEPYVVMIKDLESKLENRGHIFSKFRYKKRTVSNLIEKIKSSYLMDS